MVEHTVCQKCGVTGFEELLVFCKSCEVSAEHRYCLDILPEAGEEVTDWLCSECFTSVSEASVNDTCSNLYVKNGFMKSTYHRIELPSTLKERKKLTCGPLAREEDLHTFAKSSRTDNTFGDLSVDSDGHLDSHHSLQTSVPAGTPVNSPKQHSDRSEITEPTLGKLSSRDVEKIIGEQKHLEIDVCCSRRTSPDVAERYTGAKLSPGHINEDGLLVNGETKVGSPRIHLNRPRQARMRVIVHQNSDNQLTFGSQHIEKALTGFDDDSPQSSENKKSASSGKPCFEDNHPEIGALLLCEECDDCPVNSRMYDDNQACAIKQFKRRRLVLDDDSEEDDHPPPPSSDSSSVLSEVNSQPNHLEGDATKKGKHVMSILNDDSDEDDHPPPSGHPIQCSTKVDDPSIHVSQSPSKCFGPRPAWRGSFDVHGIEYGPIAAHVSKAACEKVLNVLPLLPRKIDFEKHSQLAVYPPSFMLRGPADHNIALFFLPGDSSVKAHFVQLVDELIVYKRALRVALDVADLLVFSSFILPRRIWQIENEFYLWGVFRARVSSERAGPRRTEPAAATAERMPDPGGPRRTVPESSRDRTGPDRPGPVCRQSSWRGEEGIPQPASRVRFLS